MEDANGSAGGERRPEQGPTHWLELVTQISLCGRQLRRLLGEVTLPWNLSDTEFLCLWSCARGAGSGVAQHDLAVSLSVSAAQMSGLVYDLRDRGLLDLERPARDRRRQQLRITGAGQLLLKRVLESMTGLLAELDRQVPRDDQKRLHEKLLRLNTLAHLQSAGSVSRGPAEDRPMRRAS
ncbi:MAG: winged helix-turn-helix transcriptional regulator [Planctomycetes bacterium]|nr:winged helix-turn-helix transcriptional regulator [Planctomycetota bacterium]